MQPPVVLTIAANDPLGGAGLAADLATFAARGVHGTAAVTAVTAQRLHSVDRVEWMDADLVAAQIDAVAATFALRAVKSGLLGAPEVIDVVARCAATGQLPSLVVDPVLVDGRGERIVGDDAIAAYQALLPHARVATPNLAEARLLVGAEPGATVEEMADALAGLGADLVVVTGGAGEGAADDAVVGGDAKVVWLRSPRIATPHVRGSGCTFAAAVTAALAHGDDAAAAVASAHAFIRSRLKAGADREIDGVGPVDHTQAIDAEGAGTP